MSDKLDECLHRIDRLERRLKVQRGVGVGVLLCLVTMLLLSSQTGDPGKPKVPARIVARSFVLQNDQGKEIGALLEEEGGARLTLGSNKSEDDRVILASTTSDSFLRLHADPEYGQIELHNLPGLASLSMGFPSTAGSEGSRVRLDATQDYGTLRLARPTEVSVDGKTVHTSEVYHVITPKD